MKITIPYEAWDTDLREMRERHSDLAGTKRPVAGGTEFDVADALMPQADLDMALSKNVRIDDAQLFVKVPASILDNLVDVDLPNSRYTDENGDEQRRNYHDYFSRATLNKAGDEALVMVGHRSYGAPNPVALVKDEEFRAWLSVFGPLLTVQERASVVATSEWIIDTQE